MNDISWHLAGKELVQAINETLPPEGKLVIWYLGQCGFVIKSRETTIGIDLVLSELYDSAGNRRRLFSPPFSGADGLHLDYLLISHNHKDHLDIPTIQSLCSSDENIKINIPRGVKQQVEELLQNEQSCINYLKTNDTFSKSDLIVQAIPVAHETYTFSQEGDSLNHGYCIQLAGFRLFHSGDALADTQLFTFLSQYRPQLLFLPINGRDEIRHQKGIIGNMNMEEAVALTKQLHSMFIPMHYDFFANNGYDVEKCVAYARVQAVPLAVLPLGEPYFFSLPK